MKTRVQQIALPTLALHKDKQLFIEAKYEKPRNKKGAK